MAFDVGFNFRATLAYVTDGTNETWINGDIDPYPTSKTVGGNTFNCGWVIINHDSQRDRDNTVAVELAGVNQNPNTGGAAEFKCDLPATGSYNIRLALGDATISQSYEYAQVLDSTTALFTVDKPAGVTAPQFYDATGTLYSAAAWPGSNTAVSCTFATTTFRMLLSPPTSQAGSSGIAHLRITQATSTATYAFSNNASIARPVRVVTY